MLDQVEQERKVKGVVFIGSKGHFISGLDVTALEKCHAAGQAESLALRYQSVLSRIRNNKKPFVAAIHGAALGGGYELALACHGRIATDAPATVVGLPEIMLGVIPCAGGSQYLPRLIGLQHALPLLLQSKQVKARKACKQGLVDKVTSKQQLLDAAVEMAHSFIGKTPDQLKQNKKTTQRSLIGR